MNETVTKRTIYREPKFIYTKKSIGVFMLPNWP